MFGSLNVARLKSGCLTTTITHTLMHLGSDFCVSLTSYPLVLGKSELLNLILGSVVDPVWSVDRCLHVLFLLEAFLDLF